MRVLLAVAALASTFHAAPFGCAKREPGGERPMPRAPSAQPTALTPHEVPLPYDEGADARLAIDSAIAASARDGKPIVLIFGANWCKWCRRLEWTIRNEAQVREAAALVRIVHVNVGTRAEPANADLNERYGNPSARGLPVLVVLNADGTERRVQDTGALELGQAHDPDKVAAFLSSVASGR